MKTYELPLGAYLAVSHGHARLVLAKVGKAAHAKVGEQVTLTAPAQQPHLDPIEVTCAVRARLILTPDGVGRLLPGRADGAGEDLARLLQASEQGAHAAASHLPKLAAACGFETFAQLYDAERARQGGGARGTLLREVIGWAPLPRELAEGEGLAHGTAG